MIGVNRRLFKPLNCALIIILSVILLHVVESAQWNKLKRCAQSGFCRRQRSHTISKTDCTLDPNSVVSGNTIRANLSCPSPIILGELSNELLPLQLQIEAFESGSFRVLIDEHDGVGRFKRFRVPDVLETERGAKGCVINESKHVKRFKTHFSVSLGNERCYESENTRIKHRNTRLDVFFSPFYVVLRDLDTNMILVSLNDRKLLRFERQNEVPKAPVISSPEEVHDEKEIKSENHAADEQNEFNYDSLYDDDETMNEQEELLKDDEVVLNGIQCDGCFSEQFDGHTDPKRRGPESFGLDIKFHSASHVFGIPEHANTFALKDTKSIALGALQGDENVDPYRLYNLDVFEYELNDPLGLYGSVPLIVSSSESHSSAVLWLNAAETYIDVHHNVDEKSISTHWFSESGVLDVILFPGGPGLSNSFEQYLELTGQPAMPSRFALGYHQCRWNYRDDADARAVDAEFDRRELPYDVLWLDIEHTNGKRYFTWDYSRFPDPEKLQRDIARRGRKMVTIIDPHIKRDDAYPVHKQAQINNWYVKKADGTTDFNGWCWPGDSSYFDFMSTTVRKAWTSFFNPTSYRHFTEFLYTWVDMNEPSVFNGPEQTMPKDLIHSGGWEHRDVHNMYGMEVQRATFDALLNARDGQDRPFVLSRSFFAGSQKYGAVWTGDNTAEWSHLRASIPMLLSLQISAIVFSGADVGGFFGNPSPELLVRWYQAAAFQPFFRGHAHLDTDRREPWLFGEDNTARISHALRERYAYLPMWYTLFAAVSLGNYLPFDSTAPPMRPLLWHYGQQVPQVSEIEDEWLVGDALLVAPILHEAAKTRIVQFPFLKSSDRWYDVYDSGRMVELVGRGRSLESKEFDVTMDRMLVFQRGGSITCRQQRVRRSSVSMAFDPFTLIVALDADGNAGGELYIDDGRSYLYRDTNAFSLRQFEMSQSSNLKSWTKSGSEKGFTGESSMIERIVISGIKSVPSSISITIDNQHRQAQFYYKVYANAITIKNPRLPIAKGNWSVSLNFK